MTNKGEIEKWLEKMGYSDGIPENFENLCNPSTSIIWQQLVSNIKPRQEIEKIRRNLIISRLKQRSLDNQCEFDYLNQDIESYKKLQQLKASKTILKQNINEKVTQIKDVILKGKKQYVTMDNLKGKIRENEEKSYLLARKSKQIKSDYNYINKVISDHHVIQHCTKSEDFIIKTLKKCAESVEDLVSDASIKPKNSKIINLVDDSLGLLSDSLLAANDDFLDLSLARNGSELFTSSPASSQEEENALLPECLQKTEQQTDLLRIIDTKSISDVLQTISHINNREIVMKTHQNSQEALLKTLKELSCEQICDNDTQSEEDLSYLHFLYIQSELKRVRSMRKFKKLEEELKKMNVTKSKALEKLQFDVTQTFVKNKVNGELKIDDDDTVYTLNVQMKNLNDQIRTKFASIENVIRNTRKILNCDLNSTKLQQLDHSWVESLRKIRSSEEIRLFNKICLDFTRNSKFLNPLPPFWIEIDSKALKAILNSIQTPFKSFDDVLVAFWALQKQLATLKTQKRNVRALDYEKYSDDSLATKEEFIDRVLIDFDKLLRRVEEEVLYLPDLVQNSIDLWTKRDFTRYIAGFDEYERKFNYFFNKL